MHCCCCSSWQGPEQVPPLHSVRTLYQYRHAFFSYTVISTLQVVATQDMKLCIRTVMKEPIIGNDDFTILAVCNWSWIYLSSCVVDPPPKPLNSCHSYCSITSEHISNWDHENPRRPFGLKFRRGPNLLEASVTHLPQFAPVIILQSLQHC